MKTRYLLYICLILLSSFLLTGCTKKDPSYDTSKIDIVDSDTQEKQEEESKDENTNSDDLGYISNPENFTREKQSIGAESSLEYTIDSVENVQSDGYHLFKFKISTTSDQPSLPYVILEPILDKGVFRVTVKGVAKDNSGIGYQTSVAVDKGAITGIYRAVTSVEKTSVYEIGFLGTNNMLLEYEETGTSSWDISVKVSYDLKYSPPSIDFGSTEFSSEPQSIEGMTSSDGARISSYSYSVSGGVLKFVYSVASGTSNPIPSVEASYDDMNILDVRFTSLDSDKVSGWAKTISLPSGIVVNVSRSGDVSSYRFGGLGAPRPFKLSATQSPNSVIVEIKLN